MIVHLGSDHAGFKLKEQLKQYLKKNGYSVKDHGANKLVTTDDYPDYAHAVAKALRKRKEDKGILVCGSAEGICIAANRHKGIRAVAVWTLQNAKLSRQHNDANVLCLSGWQLPLSKAKTIAKTWLETSFSNEERHIRRIRKIEP
ncbi:ribose 5-phosphate isomerase B [Candidatus Woesearchaeota archaeon]|nr:ribose 5-phosphate isomerase B [Candidatus Woesearchaeota archaeon]